MIPQEAVEAAREALLGYTGGCTCHEGYTMRNMEDPDCTYHDVMVNEAAAEVLKAAAPIIRAQALAEAAELIYSLTDPDTCWFDHHGGCQSHGYLGLEPGEMCPQLEAKAWLRDHGRPE